jgi:hypothetical protein
MVVSHLLVVGLKGRLENVANISIADHVRDNVSVASLESLVGDVFESHSCGVVRSSLLGVSNPEFDVIEAIEDSDSGTLGRLFVISASQLGLFVLFNHDLITQI